MTAEVEVIDVEQQSDEWWAAKRGIPSASNFADVMAGGEGKTRTRYLKRLAAEMVWGMRREEYRNNAMDRGNRMEPQLRATYALMKNVEPRQVGFVKRTLKTGFAGYSPDAFIGEDGLLECKSVAGDLMIDIMEEDRVPPEHIKQLQGGLWVSGRKWIDIVIGTETAPDHEGTDPFVQRVMRDEAYIARIALGVEVFNQDLIKMVEWVRRRGKR